MEALLPYLPTDRRHALARREVLPDRAFGSALFVDISGFTPLAEALAHDLGPQRGAEELTRYLNQVYDALIADLDLFRGSVIGFSGDAVTCWFEGDRALAATASALEMNRTLEKLSEVSLPKGDRLELYVKAGIATGTARRFVVGDPATQLIDVLAGRLLDDMAEAEHRARGGEVVLAASTVEALGDRVELRRRLDVGGRRLGVVAELKSIPEPSPWPAIPDDRLSEEQLRSWLIAPVYQRLKAGQGEFLAELRPAVALFLRFEGIDYDADPEAGPKLDDLVRRVQRILATYDGTLVDITTGDKGSHLYLAFGAPIAHEDDVERAAAAALELREMAAGLQYVSSIQIGINRGRMRTGAYGGRTRRTYGVLGDATNLAARLMMAAEPGEILVDRSTFETVEQSFRSSPRPPLQVKGKAERVQTASLVGRSELSARDRPARRHLLPMVGRERELSIVEERIGLALGGKGQVVGVTAEAGMGKSRLIAESRRLARNLGLSVYTGECKSYGVHASYLVWSGIWREIFGIAPDVPAREQTAALEARIRAVEPELAERLPLLGPLLNLAIDDNELTVQFDPQFRKVSLERMLVQLLRSVTQHSRLLIVLEDAHWIDPLSADLLKVVGQSLPGLPVLLMLAYRSEGAAQALPPAMIGWPHFTEVSLAELGPEQAKEWIRIKSTQLFGPDLRPPRAFVERLLARADGNAFYIEEVLNFLKDHAISLSDADSLSGVNLPASLDSLVLTRIDQLDERPRSTLRVASVFGRTFSVTHLLGAYPDLNPTRGIDSELHELTRKGFVEPEQGDSYIFRHGVIQEAAYGSLPFTLRRDLHSSVAEFLERTYANTIESAVDLLAYHYFRGETWPKAFEFNLQSAFQAQREYSNAAAIATAENVLEAADHMELDPEKRSEVLSAHQLIGDVLGWDARYMESVEAFRRAVEVARGWEDLFAESRAWYGMAETQMHKGDLREAIASAEQAEAISKAAGLKLAPVKSRWMQAWGAYRLGEIERAKDLARPLTELSSALDDRGQHAENLNLFGMLNWASGRYDDAQRCFTEAFGIFREMGDERRAMPLINNLGLIAESRGEFGEAAKQYGEALATARRIGDRDSEIGSLGNLGKVKVLAGNFVDGEADLRAALDIADAEGTDVLSEAFSSLAEAMLGQGRLEEALDAAGRALDTAVASNSQEDQGRAWRALGMVVARLTDVPIFKHSPLGPNHMVDAHVAFAQAARLFSGVGREDELARALRLWAKYEYESGNRDLAEANWEEAKRLYEKLGIVTELQRMGELA